MYPQSEGGEVIHTQKPSLNLALREMLLLTLRKVAPLTSSTTNDAVPADIMNYIESIAQISYGTTTTHKSNAEP